MNIELFLAFILACAILAATPGPNVSLIIANGTSFGLRAGLVTVAGCVCGIAVLVTGAILGMSSVMVLLSEWFDLIRWIGAAYLVWLGMNKIWRVRKRGAVMARPKVSGHRWFWQGLAVALSNPKPLLFLGAFFPQFIDHGLPLGGQLLVLGLAFVVVVAVVDGSYAVLAGTARSWITEQRIRLADSITGLLLICGGLWLAVARRA